MWKKWDATSPWRPWLGVSLCDGGLSEAKILLLGCEVASWVRPAPELLGCAVSCGVTSEAWVGVSVGSSGAPVGNSGASVGSIVGIAHATCALETAGGWGAGCVATSTSGVAAGVGCSSQSMGTPMGN
eukprot:6114048-Pyramimonas_sp.AAC.1